MAELLRGIHAEVTPGDGENVLYIDDAAGRTEALSRIMPGSVSLVYMDPPFRTGKKFEARLKAAPSGDGEKDAQVRVAAYSDNLPRGEYLQLLGRTLEASKLLLTDDGLVFVHVDYREHAHIRLLMDEIFGEEHFLNEIIWAYESGGRSKNFFSRKHDVILLYAKTKDYDLHIEDAAVLLAGDKKNHMARAVDEDGRSYRSIRSGGKVYRYYDDEPVPPSDVWTDISHLQQRDPQRTGYETQKPLKLLERIVKCASRPGDLVLDPFCGSGTTLEAAFKNGRRFIGIDINPAVTEYVRRRTAGSCVKIYCPESAGEASVAFERVPGITFETVYLTSAHIAGLPEQLRADGIEAVSSWAVGSEKNGVFYALSEEIRSGKEFSLKGELRVPMYTENLTLRLSDLLGRSYFFRL